MKSDGVDDAEGVCEKLRRFVCRRDNRGRELKGHHILEDGNEIAESITDVLTRQILTWHMTASPV
jgi:hypothetical protein